MADRQNELQAEGEKKALSKLQAAAGFVDRPQVERLDWMYEQSSASVKPDNDKLMNMPVEAQKDKDLADVKKLEESTSGSLFLKSATKTNEDMLRKLREDPLFQIKRQEQAAKESMMANPLVMSRVKAKEDKQRRKEMKKEQKAAKKAAKKEKKAAKKAKKAAKKAGKKSSSSDDSSESITGGAPGAGAGHAGEERPMLGRGAPGGSPKRRREASPPRHDPRDDAARLGPSGVVVDKRAEHAARIEQQKQAALASRGAPRRMSEEEKNRRYEQMRADAKAHEAHKDRRILEATARDAKIEEMEKNARNSSDQKYFRDIRKDAYMGDADKTVAERLKNQRGRRQKNLNDPLERDG